MYIAQTMKMKALFLIVINLVMAIGCIWAFSRMAPAIQSIIVNNIYSLEVCEKMLVEMAVMTSSNKINEKNTDAFNLLIDKAKNNVTATNEKNAVEEIEKYYKLYVRGNQTAKAKTIEKIMNLFSLNKEAITETDVAMKRMEMAGSWFVVFLASVVFLFAMLFLRNMTTDIILPLEEIDSVFNANLAGDDFRRCSGGDLHPDVRNIFNNINAILDNKAVGLDKLIDLKEEITEKSEKIQKSENSA